MGQYVSIHKGWVTRVSAYLSEIEDCTQQYVVINASSSGRTTRLALENMPYEVQSIRPDLMLLQFGMNDCNYWRSDPGVPRVSARAFEGNLHEIIERAHRTGVKKILLNTNHPTGLADRSMPGTSISYQESNAAYNQIIRNVAETSGANVVLTDIERIFHEYTGRDEERLLELLLPAPDLLHLSEKGHDLYYEHVAPQIVSALRDLTNGQ